MEIKYRLNRDVVGRTAAMLNWNLKQVNSSIRIINNSTMINGKSLVGILQAHMRFDDVITVVIDENKDTEEVREYFKEIGKEV